MTSINTRNLHADSIRRLFVYYFYGAIIYTHTTGMKYVFNIISTWYKRKYRKRYENLYLLCFSIFKNKIKNIEIKLQEKSLNIIGNILVSRRNPLFEINSIECS